MQKSNAFFKYSLFAALIVGVSLIRLLPHSPNFSPVGAIALFSGVVAWPAPFAFLAPLSILFVSDFFLGFDLQNIFVYASFLVIVSIGFLLRKKLNLWTLLGASLGSAMIFFVITNLGVWLSQPFYAIKLYSMTWDGLIQCFVAAIPFLKASVISQLFYSAVLFGVWAFVDRQSRCASRSFSIWTFP